MFLLGGAGVAALLIWGLTGLPHFGTNSPLYGQLLNRLAVPERSTTDVVTGVNFDYRGFDTLGEEFILFAAVLGLAILLRETRDETEGEIDDDAPQRRPPPTSARAPPSDRLCSFPSRCCSRSTSPRTGT